MLSFKILNFKFFDSYELCRYYFLYFVLNEQLFITNKIKNPRKKIIWNAFIICVCVCVYNYK